MSSATDIGAICNALESYLDDVAGGAAPVRKRTKTGGVDALLSDYNRGNSRFDGVDQGFGKRRAKEYHYIQRAVQADVTATLSTTCTGATADGYQETSFDICDLVSITWEIDMDYVSKLCEGVGNFKERVFLSKMEALNREINEKVLTKLNAAFGTNVVTGNNAAVTHDLLDANGQIEQLAFTDWLSELNNDNQFTLAPIVIAQGQFWKFNRLAEFACCNDRGAMLDELVGSAGYAYFNDQQIDTIIGANHAVVMEPGAAHLDRFYRYESSVQGASAVLDGTGGFSAWEMSDGSARGIFIDPISGLPFDMRIERECDDNYFCEMFLHFDVFTLPTDMYQATDHLTGTNGLLHYVFT